MRVAVYAPMNSGLGPTPSGDRGMIRAIQAALARAGHEPVVVSELRAYEGRGDADAQAAVARAATAERDRLLAPGSALAGCEAWLTYHCYYKNPDRLGPACAAARGLPYAIVEASYAAKREAGPFAAPAAAARRAIEAAHAVAAMTPHDSVMLARVVPERRLHLLPPFVDAEPFLAVERPARAPGPAELLTVAMMRPGKKMANFPVLARVLARLEDRPWRLSVAGDGEGRAEAEAALAPLGSRVRFLGRIAREAMPSVYGASDLLVWPGLREAYGLSFLEAAASGTPSAAFATHGVPASVEEGVTGRLAPEGDEAAYAALIAGLIDDGAARARLGASARAFVAAHRGLDAAARRLDAILRAAASEARA